MQKAALIALLLVSAAAQAKGFFIGPNDPLPRPPNPHNNPWLNYPTHYGSGAEVHQFDDATAAGNVNLFMKLGEAERKARIVQEERASLDRGSTLFNDTRLGTSGLNCMSCHPNGDTSGGKIGMGNHEIPIPALFGVAQRYPRYNISKGRVITQTEMQNNCIRMFIKGKPLAGDTQDAADLTYFVGRLQPTTK